MNLKQLQYVQVLAQTGSFSKAADALGISQPSISQYIKKIEQETGIQLFNRAGSEVRLTDAGKVYVEAGREILDIEHRMQSRFTDIKDNKEGSLVVGTSPYRSAAMMPHVIKQFHEKYPNIHVIIEEMASAELLDSAEHGQFDICITPLPVDGRIFSCEEIFEEELVLAVPKAFDQLESSEIPGRRHPVIEAGQLDGCRFVMITETQLMQKELNNLCIDSHITLAPTVTVKSLEAQISMVRAGVGMALVPSGIEAFCPGGDIDFYSFSRNLPCRKVAAIRRKDRELSHLASSFLDVIKRIDW